MSLQTIINIAETIEFDRRKVVGQQTTRSGIIKVGETPTRNPWRFNISVGKVYQYEDARPVMESIDYYDRIVPQNINFSLQPWMFAYQGDLTQSQRDSIRVTSFSGNQLVLNVSAISGNAGNFVVKAGDLIQVAAYAFPFTAVTDVQRGSGSTVTVTTHRPNFITASVANSALTFGNACSFRMIATTMPIYRVSPGGRNALVAFSGDFQLHEYTGETA
jgi:hypothetical protein